MALERNFYGRPVKRSRLVSSIQRPALATANGASLSRPNNDMYYRKGMSLDSLGKCLI
jgi:hypothetical protein